MHGAADNAPDAPDVVECDGGCWHWEDVEDPLFRLKNMTDRSLRYHKGGETCVVFGGDGLYISCYDNDQWDSILIDDSPLVGEYTALAFNQYDLPHISY